MYVIEYYIIIEITIAVTFRTVYPSILANATISCEKILRRFKTSRKTLSCLITSTPIFTVVILRPLSPSCHRPKKIAGNCSSSKRRALSIKNSAVGRILVCSRACARYSAAVKFVWRAHYSLCLARIKSHVCTGYPRHTGEEP